MNKKITFLLLSIIFFFATLVIVARNNATSLQKSSSKTVVVYTSFYPLFEFTSQVAKEHADVHNLIPAGVEPHDFEPTAKDIAGIQNSTLLITNGAGFEQWIDHLPKDVIAHTTVVNSSQNISLSTTNNFSDPHVWLDPNLAIAQVDQIQNALSTVDPEHAKIYKTNADIYIAKLKFLDQEFQKTLSTCSHNTIITSHDAFSYLAKRYNFDVISLSGLSPDQEPSAAKMAETTQLVKSKNIRYIFFESLVSPKLSEVIANETGAQTLLFNPIEGLTEQEINQGKNYIKIQTQNLTALKTALSCQ